MANYPPPYPPPASGSSQGGPYGFDPREQRRVLKEQARMQQAAYKAQRAAYKQQVRATALRANALRRGSARGSILGPLIVVALGVVLLVIRMGVLPFSRFADWYGRWWPLLFVAAGLVLVAEWAFDQTRHTPETPYTRRGVGGGVFLLLLVLAVTGAIVKGVTHRDLMLRGFGDSINPDNLAEFLGDKHEREQTIDHELPAGASLSISNPHGDVTLSGTSADGQVHIVAYKQVYSQSDSEADQKADVLAPRLVMTDGRLNVTVPTSAGSSVDLTVTVPGTALATVTAENGDVHLSALKAGVNVTVTHGDVDLNDIKGTVTARINHRDSSFSAHTVEGDVVLKGNVEDLNLTGVTGAVTLDGDFYGDTHLEHIGGPTSFKTSRTTFTFARLDGTVDVSPDAELSGEQIVGPTLLTTRSRNISLTRLTGDVTVTNSNGSVDLGTAGPMGDVTVNDRSGPVSVTVPEGVGFTVQASTSGGEISNEFGLSGTEGDSRSSVSGKVGDGHAKVTISTTHGDVGLHKAEGIVTPPPVAPQPPETPAKPKGKKVGRSVSF